MTPLYLNFFWYSSDVWMNVHYVCTRLIVHMHDLYIHEASHTHTLCLIHLCVLHSSAY